MEEIEIEAYVHMLASDWSGYIASCEGKEIMIDLFSFDLVDTDEDCVEGNVRLGGFWDKDVFVAESIEMIN